MKAFSKIILLALAVTLVWVGLAQSNEPSTESKSAGESENPYAKVSVITVAGPALILAKWNSRNQ